MTSAVVLASIGAVAVLVVGVPRMVGGGALAVLSGSMEPSINPGDVVVVVPTRPDRDVHVGDVVTFQPVSGDPTLVTHRVVAKSITANGVLFTTKGDANRADDQPIRSEQVVGKFFVRVPLVGYLTVWFGQYRTLVTSAIGLCLLGYALASVLVWIRTRPRRKAAA